MIIEGLCTTTNVDGSTNIAPMGPIVDHDLTTFLFRPFQTSTTFQNLKRTGCGVFHVTDDVGMIARAAIGKLDHRPELFPSKIIDGFVIASACRWYEFEVVDIVDTHQRSEITTELKHVGRLRDFWGLNRAKHAILEAAITATRIHLFDPEKIEAQLAELKIIVEKTASDDDRRTFEFLESFIETEIRQRP